MKCCKVLASSGLKPSELKVHLVTIHLDSQNKDADLCIRQTDSLVRSRLYITGDQCKENAAGSKASYKASRKLVIAKKPHAIEDQPILLQLQLISVVSNVLREFKVQKIKPVSLSNDTVSCRIYELELSQNILSQDIRNQ